ncbi:MAG TPA: hypothetical protein VFV38_14100 [Ktedonobacteraceae bacterium]|nr:hypothetical protein [Ktedonobacteraceae bacterium]
MFKNQTERRSYRKSPGRQYGYEYNPLRGQDRAETSTPNEAWNGEGHSSSRPGSVLVPRPDPRRTRQLLRQNILAGKSRAAVLERPYDADPSDRYGVEDDEQELEVYARPGNASRNHSQRLAAHPRPYYPERYQEFEEEQIAEDWIKHGESGPDYMDPDLGYEEDPLDERLRQAAPRFPASARRTRVLDEEDEDELLAAELLEKKRRDARRKFLLGAVAIGGAGVAAYELLPRIPDAIGTGAANIEHQLQQAFQNGVTAGANAARKELLNGLDTLEGFSLEGAIEAAKLTRVAYDVFISPLLTLAANVADDFLLVTLNALITGRKWLAQINEDSPTLAALQNVLQSWVEQAHEMPKKVQTITETDLDGAQAYLRALQRRIQQEQAQLNGQVTPTPSPHTTPKPKQ